MNLFRFTSLSVAALAFQNVHACDLCAINSATSARSEASGFVFTLGQQYIYSHTAKYNSDTVELIEPNYLETSVTHLIPAYNFNRDFGISFNVPIVRKDYRLFRFQGAQYEDGKSEGLGDTSLVARWTPWSIQKMTHTFRVNLLGGIKFPTGDTRYLREDVAEERFMDGIFGPGHDHAFSAVHLHDLTLGSGSFDGVFGLTASGRWKRLFATTEAQYYLRTEGEDQFEYGDTVMISGGPGVYAILKSAFTLNLQAVMRYEKTERATYFGGKPALQTGMREIYAGPEIGITAGPHFAAKLGADLPVEIHNNGLQITPDYRLHGSLTWSF